MKILLPLAMLLVQTHTSWADTTYTVRRGDTILKISDRLMKAAGATDRFAFSKKILAANPQLKDGNSLQPGQQIQIPGAGAAVASASAEAETISETPAPIPGRMQEAPASALPKSVKVAEAAPVQAPAPVAAAPVTATTSAIESPAVVEEAQPAEEAAPVVEQPLPEAKVESSAIEEKHAHGKHHGEGRKEEEEGDDDFFEVRPRMEFSQFKIKSEELGKELKANTHISPSINVLYGKALGSDIHLIVEAGATHTQMSSFDDAAAQLDPTKQWLRNFGIGFESEFAKVLRLEVTAQFVDHLFILPQGGDQFYLSRVMIPEAEVALNWNFLRLHGSSFGLTAEVEYNGNVHHNDTVYKGTFDPAGALYWETHLGEKRMNYRVSATYSADAQHAETLEQDAKTYGLNLQLLFPI